MNMTITMMLRLFKASPLKMIIFFWLLIFTITGKAQHNSVKIHVGLIYPLSSNGRNAPLDTNDFSIHLIAGLSATENGPAFAGVSNVVRGNTYGAQFAGFSNHIGKKASGALFAGFANTYGQGHGIAFAGFGNVAHGNLKGAQFAGFGNVANNVNGVQFAGAANLANELKGSQFAGFLNAASNVSASQFAGFINVAKKVKGSQFAGFINIAKNVKGTQFAGFINIADSSDYPIGILNFIKNGEKSFGLSIDENETSMLTFRSGGKVLYGILGLGYNFKNKDDVYAAEAGLGVHFFQSNVFRVSTELTASSLTRFESGEYFRTSLKMFPTVKLFKHIALFVGPSFNYTNTNSTDGLALNSVHKRFKTWQHMGSSRQQTLSLGYSGGFQVIF